MSKKRTLPKSPAKTAPRADFSRDSIKARVLDLFAACHFDELAVVAQEAVECFPGEAFFWKALGVARGLQQERGDRVIQPLSEAARLNPNDAEVFDALALALARVDRIDEGLVYGAKAVALAPAHPVLLTNYGNLLVEKNRYHEAISFHRRALSINPNLTAAWNNLGAALRGMPWRHAEAQDAYLCAIAQMPNHSAAWDNLLFIRQYQSEPTPLEILREALTAGEHLTLSIPPRCRPSVRELNGRQLRVGWVSSDMREHTVGNALVSVLPHLAGHGVEIFAYNNSLRHDDTTERMKQSVGCWRDVAALTDDALTDLIVADQVDVLVDLSGRTRGHRLGVFARRAAAVQVSWLGWFSTTGLPQIDWYLADRVTLPETEHRYFAERCWAIDGPYYVQQRPGVNVLPVCDGYPGPIRFGCFNNLGKLSTRTFDLWSRILLAVPDATLKLKSAELTSTEVRTGVLHEFERRGVSGQRIQLDGLSPLLDYLRAFNGIDLCLDPTPFTGGATSFDSLLMGVPVLTLSGDRLLTHQGENLLLRLGMREWITTDEASYVARAVAAAADLDALRSGRTERHQRFLDSPLVDGAALAAQLAAAWLGMHQRALAGDRARALPDDPVALRCVGAILLHLEEWDGALAVWDRIAAQAREPLERADAQARRGIALQGAERFADALTAYREALAMPGEAAAYTLHLNSGVCLHQLQRHDEAIRHAEAALQARPGDPVAQRNLAVSALDSGDIERAQAVYGGLRGVLAEAATAWLFGLNVRQPYDPRLLCREHRAWGEHAVRAAAEYFAGLPEPAPAGERPRRIGFLSQDFRLHPVACFTLPMLRELAAGGIYQLVFYSDVRQGDSVTEMYRALPGEWVDCTMLDDRALATRIRADRIDVLVDLGGLTGQRPAMLAARHAPLQLSWLGYSATSGFTTVDARLTDSALDPPGLSEAHYVEPLSRLDPSFVSFDPLAATPEVTQLPAASGQPLRFASFHKPSKLNRSTFRLWGAALRSAPGSRLLLVGDGLAEMDSTMHHRFAGWLVEEGIEGSRVSWRNRLPHADYLALHGEVDLALDCVPWSGHTVTAYAAWMGVPTLAFGGAHHAGCFSVTTLHLLGLDDFCFDLADVQLSERIATFVSALDTPAGRSRLAELRVILRDRLRASPLGDHAGLARRFSEALSALWIQQR